MWEGGRGGSIQEESQGQFLPSMELKGQEILEGKEMRKRMRIVRFVIVLILCWVIMMPIACAEVIPEERGFPELLHQAEAEYLSGNFDAAKDFLKLGYYLLLEQTDAEDKPWTSNKSWWGSGTKTTEPFQIKALIWRIRWEQSKNYLLIVVYKGTGELDNVIFAGSKGEGASYFNFKKGTFYLYITSIGEWKIWIEEKS